MSNKFKLLLALSLVLLAGLIMGFFAGTVWQYQHEVEGWERCRQLPENDSSPVISSSRCLQLVKALAEGGEEHAIYQYWLSLDGDTSLDHYSEMATKWLLKNAELGQPKAIGNAIYLCGRRTPLFTPDLIEHYLYAPQCKNCDSMKHGWENNYFVFEKCLAQKNKKL